MFVFQLMAMSEDVEFRVPHRIAEGIKEAVDWFVANYDSARK